MKIHGEWEITLVRNVLVRTTAGSFNDEGTQACFLETQQKAPSTMAWAGLTNAANWEMSSATSLQAFAHMREWAFTHGCTCLAVVVPNRIRMEIHRRQTGNAPQDLVHYFSSLETACTWLTGRGFAFTLDDYPHQAFVDRTGPVG
ncbi:hypothetical protein BH11PSE12_BH11PSE12_19810 [soil metagenome]